MKVRLHKWLASQGIASRRQAERWIEIGRVEVNGKVDRTLGQQIDPEKDFVRVDGKTITSAAPALVYWVLHKPDCTLTTRVDPAGRPTIYDLPSLRQIPFPVVPVGRLDFRTEGLLLLSNDGELVHRLMHPSFHVPRTYDVLLPEKLTLKQLEIFDKGFRLSEGPTAPMSIAPHGSRRMGATRGYRYRLTVHEGRNRLVRRVFEKLGVRVVRLIRSGYGPIRLTESIPAGQVAPLTPKQIEYLKQAVGLIEPARLPERKNLPSRKPKRERPSPIAGLRKPEPKSGIAPTP